MNRTRPILLALLLLATPALASTRSGGGFGGRSSSRTTSTRCTTRTTHFSAPTWRARPTLTPARPIRVPAPRRTTVVNIHPVLTPTYQQRHSIVWVGNASAYTAPPQVIVQPRRHVSVFWQVVGFLALVALLFGCLIAALPGSNRRGRR